MLLTRNGFDAVAAADRASARDLAAEHRPAAAVIDLGLPSIQEGLQLIRELKALDSAIRVLVLTGSSRKTVENDLDRILVDDLFVKPAPTAALIRTLRSYESTPPKEM